MKPVRELVETLDRAAEHDVAVDVLLHPGIAPWMYREYPELQYSGWGFIPYDIDHPKVREHCARIVRLYLEGDGTEPGIANHPALLSYCLMNEPLYTDGGPSSSQNFQKYLTQKFKSIERVNDLLGTDYPSLEAIPAPDIHRNGHDNRAFWLEWCRFNNQRLVSWHVWMRDIIRESDRDTPVHTKIQHILFEGQRDTAWGQDHVAFAKMDRIAGNDCINYYTPKETYAQKWNHQQLYYVFQKSVAPDNPIFNSENHLVSNPDPWLKPGRHIRTALWTAAMEGQGATTSWMWE